MKLARRIVAYVLCAAVGITLLVLGMLRVLDSFWSGMGSALLVVAALRFIRMIRFKNDESYREKVETEVSDERNRFLRDRAWAWTGYLFVLTASVCTIVFKVMGQELLSMATGYAVCLMLVLYWVSYLILRRKY